MFSILKLWTKKAAFYIGLCLILIIGWYLIGSQGSYEQPVPPALVSVAKVVKQDVGKSIDLIGTVMAFETVAVKTRLDSQIMKVNIKEGQTVNVDDVLFQLDDRLLKAQLAQQEAIIKSNEAELERSKLDLARAQSLADKGVGTKQSLDTALSAFKTAEANVESTKAQIANIKTQLDFATIRSPIEGRTGTIQHTLGNTVKANDTTALVTINKVKPIKVRISVPQRYYQEVREATKDSQVEVTIRNTAGELLEKGKTLFKENLIDDTTRTLAVTAVFDNKEEKLWPGMFVDVNLALGIDKQVLTVPLKAVLPGQEGDHVYSVVDNKAVRKSVKLVRSVGDLAIIEGDIAEGDIIVTDGLLRLRDGTPVKLHSDKTKS